jgi:hypothetical protein
VSASASNGGGAGCGCPNSRSTGTVGGRSGMDACISTARAAHQQRAAHQFDPCLGMHEVGNRGRGEAVAPVVCAAWVGRGRVALHGGDAHLRERLNQRRRKELVDLAGVGATLRKICPPP